MQAIRLITVPFDTLIPFTILAPTPGGTQPSGLLFCFMAIGNTNRSEPFVLFSRQTRWLAIWQLWRR
jgi:hypothetical protein